MEHPRQQHKQQAFTRVHIYIYIPTDVHAHVLHTQKRTVCTNKHTSIYKHSRNIAFRWYVLSMICFPEPLMKASSQQWINTWTFTARPTHGAKCRSPPSAYSPLRRPLPSTYSPLPWTPMPEWMIYCRPLSFIYSPLPWPFMQKP